MASLQKEQNRLIVASLAVIAMVAIGIVLIYARSVLIPFVLAVFITLLILPILDFLVLKAKFPRILAVPITIIIVLIILTVLFMFLSYAVQSVISTAGQYTDSFTNLIKVAFEKFEKWGFNLNQDEIIKTLQKRIPGLIKDAFGTAFSFISTVFLVLVFVILMLIGRDSNVIQKGIYFDIEHQIRHYISIKLTVSAMTGFLVWLVFVLFKLELANVFGILTFLLNFIPSIGSIIAILLPIPIAVAQFQNPWLVLLVVGIPGVIQMIIGNGIEPRLMGKGLHLHPVTILLTLSFWGLLWGIPGMFLAVPITAVIRIILMQFDTLKPIGNILAGELPES
jgi:AI-2 transport protein TqsA